MDELFLCPDCYELHDEPAEATLGHLVRCLACDLAAETALAEARPPIPRGISLAPTLRAAA
jgi:hypothetical protein